MFPILQINSLITQSIRPKVRVPEEERVYIGVDSLKFVSLDGIYKALGFKNGRDNSKPKFTDHYFSGDYMN